MYLLTGLKQLALQIINLSKSSKGEAMRNKITNRHRQLCIGMLLSWTFIFCSPNITFAESEKLLQPVGQTVGITLQMDGVTIVDTADFEDQDGKSQNPAKDAGIKAGDIIKKMDGKHVADTKALDAAVQEGNEIVVSYERNGKLEETTITPYLAEADGRYHIGVWVKDAASGIGTVTYIDPENGQFVALGHGISDPSSGQILEISEGDILKSTVVSVQKGGRGEPGELIGVFADGREKLGDIERNTLTGLVGSVDDISAFQTACEPVPIAKRENVHEGTAYILSNIEGNKVEKFEVEIQKINKDTESTKGMVIKVTDGRLLEKTGGIVQGMSGSPIIQDDHFVGAVTHVFVNAPEKGYAIFMDALPKAD